MIIPIIMAAKLMPIVRAKRGHIDPSRFNVYSYSTSISYVNMGWLMADT